MTFSATIVRKCTGRGIIELSFLISYSKSEREH